MQVTIILIVIGTFGKVTNRFLKGLDDLEVGGRGESIQTTTLLRTETEKSPGDMRETCCHSNPSEKPSANPDVKNSNE